MSGSGIPTQVEQPTGIEWSEYVTTWPGLEPEILRLRQGARAAVKTDLQHLVASSATASDGALNLLAQLEREDRRLDDAEALMTRAIASKRAQGYFEWAVRCRPDSPRAHEALGDYFAAVGDAPAATAVYEAALHADPQYLPAREKLEKLRAAK